jgi:serine/threonine-protein kinase RsbW
MTGKQAVELKIPSRWGYEKMAMKLAGIMAQQLGFPPERVADLSTAVSEACLNAIEHGNRLEQDALVSLTFIAEPGRLCIEVSDEGRGGPPPVDVPEPDIKRKVAGEEGLRQMGLHLIRSLVDEAGFVENQSQAGSTFRIVFILAR